jgi:chromosome segregation ATPase
MKVYVFPRLARLRIELLDELAERLRAFADARGWALGEAVKILLAYAADTREHRARTTGQISNEWSAARAEMARLRHRAYSADEGIRSLQMNARGLEASNGQFQRSLPQVETEVARLQAEVDELRRVQAGRGDADGSR